MAKVILPVLFSLFFYIKARISEEDEKLYHLNLVTQLPFKVLNSPSDIIEKVKYSDSASVMFLYRKDSLNSRKAVPIISLVEERLKQYIKFYKVDCTDLGKSEQICKLNNEEDIDEFPRIIVLKPPEYRENPYTKKLNFHTSHMFQESNVSFATIFNFTISHLKSNAIQLTSDNIESFLL